MRFVVLSTTNGGRTGVLKFRCGLTDAGALEHDATRRRRSTISRSRLESWSPDSLAIPEIPDAAALALLSGDLEPRSRRSPIRRDGTCGLAASSTPPTIARTSCRSARSPPAPAADRRGKTAVAISSVTSIGPRWASPRMRRRGCSIARPSSAPRIAYRDVASATNKLTLIAAMLPAGTVSTHTVFVSKTTARRSIACGACSA